MSESILNGLLADEADAAFNNPLALRDASTCTDTSTDLPPGRAQGGSPFDKPCREGKPADRKSQMRLQAKRKTREGLLLAGSISKNVLRREIFIGQLIFLMRIISQTQLMLIIGEGAVS
jgi:hypothetical protein